MIDYLKGYAAVYQILSQEMLIVNLFPDGLDDEIDELHANLSTGDVVSARAQYTVQIWIGIITVLLAIFTYLAISAALFIEHRIIYRDELNHMRSSVESTSNKVDNMSYKLMSHFENHEKAQKRRN